MLVIRLFRIGKRNQPSFKVVVTDKRKAARRGRFVEELGFCNPLKKEKALKVERIKHWLSVGAQPSATIYNLLVAEKILEGKKIPRHKKAKKKEGKPTEVVSAFAPASAEGKAEKKITEPQEKKEEKK